MFVPVRSSEEILLASLVPQDELLAGVTRVRDQSVLISLGLLALALILAVAVSRHISRSLGTLARAAEQIRALVPADYHVLGTDGFQRNDAVDDELRIEVTVPEPLVPAARHDVGAARLDVAQ